jgi:ABC-type branched-subunit amino acid transport system ATPase component
VHGIVGSNGSGKTTLLNLISGVYRPDAGAIRLGDRDITRLPAHRIARAGVGRTFQTPAVLQRLTVLDNVLLGAHSRARSNGVAEVLRLPAARRDDRRLRAEAATWLSFVGIAEHAREQASVLPHGQQRLLEIARAMLLEPAVLLLDEPAAGLSMAELERLSETIDAIRGLGVTVLLVEHHLDMVAGVATSVTALDQGRVIAQGTPAEVFASPAARQAYMGAAK